MARNRAALEVERPRPRRRDAEGLSTNAPPCPAEAALRRALRLVDSVIDWLIPEVLTNQQQSLQETKHDAAQKSAGQGRMMHLWKVR